MKRGGVVLLGMLGLATSSSALVAQEEEIRWLAEEAAGILPLEDEQEVLLRGVTGTLEVRTGQAEEVRWSCTASPGGREVPLAAGMAGHTIVLTVPGGDAMRRRVVLSVPERLGVRIEADGSEVVGSNVKSSLSVRGRDLDVRFLTQAGPIELDLQGGRAVLDRPSGRAVLRGRPETAVIANAAGSVVLAVEGGTIEVQFPGGGLEADVSDAKLSIVGGGAPQRVRARGGEVRAEDIKGGAEFELSGAPLHLEKASGEVIVRTDAAVQFKDTKADLHIFGVGASVRGAGHHGLLEIETDSAEVLLSSIDGPLRVRGNSLTLRLEQTTETALITSGSTVELRGVSGPLAIENDLGDITVRGAAAKVEIKNRDGNITLEGLTAAAIVQTRSEVLTAGWVSFPTEGETVLVNEDGVVRVELPSGGQVELDVQSHYGQVESSLDWVRVSDDGRSAKGLKGRQKVPRMRIVGEGGVVLGGPGTAEAVEQDGGGEP